MLFQPIHVVRKTNECANIILNFLQNYRKLTAEEARSLLNSRSEWYGVVDGQQRLYAVIDLIQNVPNDWDSFLFNARIYPDAQPFLLRSVGRLIHAQRELDVVVEETVYDLMLAIRKEDMDFRRLSGKQTTTNPRIICALLNGDSVTPASKPSEFPANSDKLRRFIAVVQSIDKRVISAIGDVVNLENKQVALSKIPKGTPENNVDFRIFRHLFTRTNLLGSKDWHSFHKKTTDPLHPFAVEIQVSTIRRVKYAMQAGQIDKCNISAIQKQFICSKRAYAEILKFKSFLGNKEWPPYLSKLRDDICNTTKKDRSIESNFNNTETLLPDLFHLYEKSEPGADVQYNTWINSSRAVPESGNTNTVDTECNDTSSVNQTDSTQNSQNSSSADGSNKESRKNHELTRPQVSAGTKKTQDDNGRRKEQVGTTRRSARLQNNTVPTVVPMDSEDSSRSNGKEIYIKRCNVETWQTTLDNYKCEVIGVESFQGFELMITTILRDFCMEKLDEFIQFLKAVMKSESYIIIFVQFLVLHKWLDRLLHFGFEMMKNPFIITHAPDGRQERDMKKFPQCTTDFALIGTVPKRNTSMSYSFKPDLRSFYSGSSSRNKRNYNFINNIPKFYHLEDDTKKPLNPDEKHSELISNLIQTFSPPRSSVFDPFDTAYATLWGVLQTDRRGVSLAGNKKAHELATKRLLENLYTQPDIATNRLNLYNSLSYNSNTLENSENSQVISAVTNGDCDENNIVLTQLLPYATRTLRSNAINIQTRPRPPVASNIRSTVEKSTAPGS